jgi:class 3 adenylate cyclase/tetratricopeptide (TPR) repeat protein
VGITCSACGAANRDGARFCAACGERNIRRCATCDEELPEAGRFCDACGAPVVDTPAAGATSAEGRGRQTRKTVTIVFADLQGSTGLQERMDPERVRSLMDRYYAEMRYVVEAHGGKVVKFVGDGIMAVFGVPEVAEHDALWAVRAAAAMHHAFEPLATDVRTIDDADISLRVGVNTGEVIVDADDTDVVGDAVNVAARLEQTAGSGEVLVGAETWRLTRHMASYAEAGALTVRGRMQPVPAQRLVAVAEADLGDSAAGPFVGRASELRSLRTLFDDVVEHQRARLATVIGSPGVGKSRLVRELGTRLGDEAIVLSGVCAPAGASTFAPVADLIAGLDGVSAGDSDHERLVKVTEGLAGAGPPATPEETFWAIRRVIELAARRKPVLAVLEDVHWAEPLLLDLVEHLAEWLTEPVLLVVVARPELREIRPSLTEPHGAAVLLPLEGLDGEATDHLACELLATDEMPAALLARLRAASDGNPLFVRELVRMLVDDGVLRRVDGIWALAVDAAAVDMPPTIHSLLASRLDRLRPEERTVLERAAVIGAEVYRGALDELVPREIKPDLDRVLESLRRKELLEPAGTYWIDERVLRFHHALIRDAAYRRLLKESRAGLHERAAAWLVAKTGGEADHDETIGYHLEQAQANLRSLGPLDGHGRAIAADAAARLSTAARRALDRDDLLAAAAVADRSLACLDPGDAARADVLLTLCEAVLSTGDVAAARPAVDELGELAAGDPRLEALAACFRAQWTSLTDASGLAAVEPTIVHAAERLADLGDAAGAAKAHRVHASLLARLGQVGACEAALDRALGAAREADDRRQVTGVLAAAPLAALWGPSPVPRAGGRCLDVIRLVRITTGAPTVEATSIRCQAALEAFRGRADAARSLLATARSMAEELGLQHSLLEVDLFAGIVELCAGDAEAADRFLSRAADGFTAMGVTTDAAQAAALRARAALALGRAEDALRHAATSEALGGQDLKTAIAWRAVKAEVLAQRGSFDQATALAREAVALAAPTDALVDHADACAALAAVLRASGDRTGAAEATHEARSLYEKKGATALAGVDTADAAGPSRRAPVLPAALANHSSRLLRRVFDLLTAGRIDEIAELIAHDMVNDDRRPGMVARIEGDEAMEMMRVLGRLGVTRIDTRVLAVRGDDLSLTESLWQGAFEVPILTLFRTAADGLAQYAVTLDPGELPTALYELDELHAQSEGATHATCLRANARAMLAHNTRDWDAFRAAVADDIAFVDHGPAGYGELTGVDRFTEMARSLVELAPDYTHIGSRLLAVDDHCCLLESTPVMTGAEGSTYDRPRLILTRLRRSDGPIERYESFDPDQLDEAWARYRQFSEPLGAALRAVDALATAELGAPLANAATRHNRKVLELLAAGRWAEIEPLYGDDVVHEDRRAGLSHRVEGRAAVLEQFRAVAAGGESRFDAEILAIRGEHLALSRTVYTARGYEVRLLIIHGLDASGREALSVLFDADDLDTALATLDELHRRSTADVLENEATRHSDRVLPLLADGRWSEVELLFAPDAAHEDRRAGLGHRVEGRAAVLEQMRAVAAAGAARFEVDRIAIRGERLVLSRLVYRARNFEVPLVNIDGLDAAGREVMSILFDADDLTAALVELDDRYLADEGAGFPIVAALRDSAAAYSARDWPRFRQACLDDLVVVDHRLALSGEERGPERVIERYQALVDHLPAIVVYLRRYLELSPRTGLAEFGQAAASASGDPYAFSRYLVAQINADGLLERLEYFDDDQLGEAQRRYAELSTAETHAIDTSRYTRTFDLALAGRFDELPALASPSYVMIDNRAGIGTRLSGPDAMVEHLRAIAELGYEQFNVEVVATRGERLALLRGTYGGGGFEGELLLVQGKDEDGRDELAVLFDVDDVTRALIELDERYADGGSQIASNAALRHYHRLSDLLACGRPERISDVLSEDAVSDDRRRGIRVRFEGRDAVTESFVATARAGVDRIVIEPLALRGDKLALARTLYVGSKYEVDTLTVIGLDDDGKGQIAVMFDPDDRDAALVELDRLAAQDSQSEDPLVNAATLGNDWWFAALLRRDWESVEAALIPDFVLDDQREGLQNLVEDRGAAVAWLRTSVAVGLEGVDVRTEAVRGERLAMRRVVWRTDGFEVPSRLVVEIDEHGRGLWCGAFDEDRLPDAIAALEDRFFAGEGAPYESWLRPGLEIVVAHGRHDWDRQRQTYAEDVVYIDHSPVGLGERHGVDEIIAYNRAMVDLAPDHAQIVRRLLTLGANVCLAELLSRSEGDDGPGGRERVGLMVSVSAPDGRIVRIERFSPEQADTAWARYEELNQGSPTPL